MIKPDGVQRGLIAEVIKRFEQKGFHLRGMKIMNVSRSHAETHYSDLSDKYVLATTRAADTENNCMRLLVSVDSLIVEWVGCLTVSLLVRWTAPNYATADSTILKCAYCLQAFLWPPR